MATVLYLSDVHSLGLKVAQGLQFTESFYWDLNNQTRGFSHERIQTELYGRSDSELEALVAEVLAEPAEPELPPVRSLVEVALAPGVRLVADPEALAALDDDARKTLVERFAQALGAFPGGKARRGRD